MIDRYTLQEQLIEKCKNKYEEAYAIADKKTAELLCLDERTKEQREELYAWNEIRNYLANTLTYKYMKEEGYQTLYHGECCYLQKIEREDKNHEESKKANQGAKEKHDRCRAGLAHVAGDR